MGDMQRNLERGNDRRVGGRAYHSKIVNKKEGKKVEDNKEVTLTKTAYKLYACGEKRREKDLLSPNQMRFRKEIHEYHVFTKLFNK